MITKCEMMDNTKSQATYALYIEEIITEANVKSCLSENLLKMCAKELAGGNKHLNPGEAVTSRGHLEMRLDRWDSRTNAINSFALSQAFKKRGDFVTQASLVSVIKHAAMIESAQLVAET